MDFTKKPIANGFQVFQFGIISGDEFFHEALVSHLQSLLPGSYSVVSDNDAQNMCSRSNLLDKDVCGNRLQYLMKKVNCEWLCECVKIILHWTKSSATLNI